MFPRLCALLLVLALVPLQADPGDNVIHMTPEFALTFPLDQKGKDVTVKYPILINPSTVLKPGYVLRIMYILRTANVDGSTDLVLAHKGNMEQSYSRDTQSPDGVSKLPPEMAHEIEGYRRNKWEVSNNFVLAMAQLPTDSMHLIYSPTGKNIDVTDSKFSFFDGLLVGLPDGKVTVIAVEKSSKAERAGIKAGDEITAVGDIPTHNDLSTFATAYATTKVSAKEYSRPSYSLTIRSPGSSDARNVNVDMPPSLKNNLLQGL